MDPIAAKSVFITGAAAGIGRAVAARFAQAGWFVGLYDVDEAGLAIWQQTLPPDRCHVGRLDVTCPEDWARQLDAFTACTGGQLHLLVNNAGISATAPFEETPLARHHRLIDINLKGVVNGCHLAFPHLRQTPDARVINLCSASALFGQPMLSTYSATKAAIRNLTEALNIEWRAHGIRVVDVLPLFVNTAMVTDDVSKMKTVQRLGVRLTAADIATHIWRLAQRPAHRLPLHSPIGWQTHCFYWLSKYSPDFLNRWTTARMAGYK
jgi:NAD(P)-dependent dehydrogenase (short-subunit alcohol dehydrogenase family)